ncbi:hypothetical protein BDZ91DRAFT_164104 [Kalaharituber pfeilii]|nr:hypothetical protein BDZ91DRAFT_164104 [Kalaharituber pfeilii]
MFSIPHLVSSSLCLSFPALVESQLGFSVGLDLGTRSLADHPFPPTICLSNPTFFGLYDTVRPVNQGKDSFILLFLPFRFPH